MEAATRKTRSKLLTAEYSFQSNFLARRDFFLSRAPAWLLWPSLQCQFIPHARASSTPRHILLTILLCSYLLFLFVHVPFCSFVTFFLCVYDCVIIISLYTLESGSAWLVHSYELPGTDINGINYLHSHGASRGEHLRDAESQEFRRWLKEI